MENQLIEETTASFTRGCDADGVEIGRELIHLIASVLPGQATEEDIGRIRPKPVYRDCDIVRAVDVSQNPAIPEKADGEHSPFVSKNTHSPEKDSSRKAPFKDPTTQTTDTPQVDPLISQNGLPLIHIGPTVAETGNKLPDEASSSKRRIGNIRTLMFIASRVSRETPILT